ncbi:hypothetical protein P0W64_09850 [Tsukamurella sp. 8F]|uniref:hypothetical protein n=1 Tax=unclassified Tsukamurella TaxID=2633480 RepID=UPI0023B92965|nr:MULTISPECIES: hypothetical protein [unclassified Tsukamurella]MDF0529418.1 hypothetical protein [Tsukamurella sp. 8J]MDF0587075.1 hypothetical protein [Tsukamurella sp. 8F]
MDGQLPRLPSLRVLWARWCVLAAGSRAMTPAPMPFGIVVDGPVGRYRASSTAGAMLARFGADRAVLSCGDVSWRVSGSRTATELLADGPDWADHVSMVDHHLRSGHFGWIAYWNVDGWRAAPVPDGVPLPPTHTTSAVAEALSAAQVGSTSGGAWTTDVPVPYPADSASGTGSHLLSTVRDTMFHVTRMAEYEWLDRTAWETAFGGSGRDIEAGWRLLEDQGLTTATGSGPITEDVDGRTADQAVVLAAQYAEQRRIAIPDDVRVDSAFRRESGWEITFSDYRDTGSGRTVAILVADNGWVGRTGAAGGGTGAVLTGTRRIPAAGATPWSAPG